MRLLFLTFLWVNVVLTKERFGISCPELGSDEEKSIVLGRSIRVICYTTDFLLYTRNLLRDKCETREYCRIEKCSSFAWKDPLNGCQVYESLTIEESKIVSKDIESIYPWIITREYKPVNICLFEL